MKILIPIFALSLGLFACNPANKMDIELKNDNRISEQEIEITQDCDENAFQDSSSIINNLPGDWALVGYACGFCAPGPAAQASISLSADGTGTAVFSSPFAEEELTFTWQVDVYRFFDGDRFALVTEPQRDYLNMGQFCEDFMYRNDTPVDGPLYIYQKQ